MHSETYSTKFDVLVIGFNRPDKLKTTLESLPISKVRKLYVSIDGPRNEQDAIKCKESLIIAREFSSKILVTIQFLEINFGCRGAVTKAIDWFFSQTNLGLIIEDDCILQEDFFDFLQNNTQLLTDKISSVGAISAHNPIQYASVATSPILSPHVLISGWVTTSKIWYQVRKKMYANYRINFRNSRNERRSPQEAIYFYVSRIRAILGLLDTWDSPFTDEMWRLGYKCLLPKYNMVSNIGFDEHATHTKDGAEKFTITLPKTFINNKTFHEDLDHHYYGIKKSHAIKPLIGLLYQVLFKRKKRYEETAIHEWSR